MAKDKNKLAIEVFDAYAQVYQEKYMDISRYQLSLENFCNQLGPEVPHILDVACGPGNITKFILDRHPDWQVQGIDLSKKMLQLAQKNNPKAQFQVLDARSIQTLSVTFDGVICGFGLPYLSKAEAIDFIQQARRILRPGGLLYISTMEDDYEKSGIQFSSDGGSSLYIYFHEAAHLTATLQSNGFELVDLQRVEYIQHDKPVTDLILMAKATF